MKLRRAGESLVKLSEQAEEMPRNLRPFCRGVVQLLAMLVGRASADKMAANYENWNDEPEAKKDGDI